jgi:hypothetical protein
MYILDIITTLEPADRTNMNNPTVAAAAAVVLVTKTLN